MKGGGKGKLAKPRDFHWNPFVIFGEPLAEGCFRSGVGVVGGGGGAWGGVFINVFISGGVGV